jgi:hypothetical protein
MKYTKKNKNKNTDLISPTLDAIDYLISAENATPEYLLKRLTGIHSMFDSAIIDNDKDIEFASEYGIYCFIRIHKNSGQVHIRSLFRLKDKLFTNNAVLLKLLQDIPADFPFINCTLSTEPGDVWIRSQCSVVVTGGVTVTSLLETIKAAVTGFVGIQVTYDHLMYVYD